MLNGHAGATGAAYPRLALLAALAIFASCAPPVERPTGWAQAYGDAADIFAKAEYDRALQFSDPIASSTPPNAYTHKALVLRAVVFAGQVRAYKELEDAYAKGVKAARSPDVKGDFQRVLHDCRQYAAQAAVGLAETAMRLTKGGTLPKELALEARYPSVEGPVTVTQLDRVVAGGKVGAEDEDAAARDAIRKGVDETLGDLVGGDRAKARSAMSTGMVQLDSLDFALFLDQQLLNAASLFDAKHANDPSKLRMVCDQADQVTQAALAALKDNPNKDKEKQVKKLQDQIKNVRKSV